MLNSLIQFMYDLIMCNWKLNIAKKENVQQVSLILDTEKKTDIVPEVIPVKVG